MELTFHISTEDAARLFLVKDLEGKKEFTANDFAKEILERELRRLFPPVPRYDDDGEIINKDGYRG